jgi:transcriptional regulator with XRE-family HTH domain
MKHRKVFFSPEVESAIMELDKSPSFIAQGLKYEIGAQVLRIMEEDGVSRADLAKRLGKSRQYVTKMLKADTNFTLDSIAALSVALGRDFHFTFVRPGASARLYWVVDGGKRQGIAMTTVEAPSSSRVEGNAFVADEYAVGTAASRTSRSPALPAEAM